MILKLKKSNYILRPWRSEDAPAIVSFLNQKDIRDNLQTDEREPITIKWVENFILEANQTPLPSSFAICDSHQPFGSIFLKTGVGIYRYSAELYYCLSDKYWNQGIISDAIRSVTTYAFQELKIKRVYSIPFSSNPASYKVLEKAGFQYEGRLKCSVFKEGQFIDQLIYSRTSFAGVEG